MKTENLISTAAPTPKISFPFKGGIYLFSPSDIIRLKADSNYTYIHVRDHKPILMAKVLSAYESILEPFGFIRIHRSHIINPEYVQQISSKGEVIMQDQSRAEVSRRKRRDIIEHLHQRVEAA